MGVVNVTPDSFSDGGAFLDRDAAVRHGLRLAFEGADLLDVGGETIRTTDIHPFWVEGKGWTKAGAIVAGDELKTKDGQQLTVIASTSEPQGGSIMPASLSTKPRGTTTVYDLEVAETHTFFVSPRKVLVHNKN